MGLDPQDPIYDGGDVCAVCVLDLFGGVTPKYVLAVVTGIETCPGVFPPSPPPNGSFILTQIAPCQWRVFINGYQLLWKLTDASSVFFIQDGLRFWFYETTAVLCLDSFINRLICRPDGPWSETGIVTLFWGPQIGKEPIT